MTATLIIICSTTICLAWAFVAAVAIVCVPKPARPEPETIEEMALRMAMDHHEEGAHPEQIVATARVFARFASANPHRP